jgi:hypothetical protein
MSFRFYNGEVATNPSDLSDLIRVAVPNLRDSKRRMYGPMSFRPQIAGDGGVRIPERGDDALVAVDGDGGQPWIIDWSSTDQDTTNYTP